MVRLLSILLAFSFLTGQVGLTFATHYCQGEAVESGILWTSSEGFGCGMERTEKAPCSDRDQEQIEKHCCANEKLTVRNEQEHLPSTSLISELHSFLSLHEGSELLELFSFSLPTTERSSGLSPPVGVHSSIELPLLFQVFRL